MGAPLPPLRGARRRRRAALVFARVRGADGRPGARVSDIPDPPGRARPASSPGRSVFASQFVAAPRLSRAISGEGARLGRGGSERPALLRPPPAPRTPTAPPNFPRELASGVGASGPAPRGPRLSLSLGLAIRPGPARDRALPPRDRARIALLLSSGLFRAHFHGGCAPRRPARGPRAWGWVCAPPVRGRPGTRRGPAPRGASLSPGLAGALPSPHAPRSRPRATVFVRPTTALRRPRGPRLRPLRPLRRRFFSPQLPRPRAAPPRLITRDAGPWGPEAPFGAQPPPLPPPPQPAAGSFAPRRTT